MPETLIARLEKLSGPDREVDGAIAVAITPTVSSDDDLVYARARDPGNDATHPGHYFMVSRSGAQAMSAPRYTESVDAALTLVPDSHDWPLFGDNGEAMAGCMPASEDGCDMTDCHGANPAIALCIASLRAKAASAAKRREG